VGRFALLYLFFEVACPASEVHRQEIARFAALAGGELDFKALSYQPLCEGLSTRTAVDATYLRYLRARYVPESTDGLLTPETKSSQCESA
jgi:hypothetical protein